MRAAFVIASSIMATLAFASQATPGLPAATHPFTLMLTYTETDPGKDIGQTTVGVVGRGRLSLQSAGLPLTGIDKGGAYVDRMDIGASGNYHNPLVLTFASRALGRLCLTGSVVLGKFESGLHFVPVSGTLASAGGTGQAARLLVSAKYKVTDVVGTAAIAVKAKGLLVTSLGPATPPTKACLAVAKLAKR